MRAINDEGPTVYETGGPSKSQSSEQSEKSLAAKVGERKIRGPKKRTVAGWLCAMGTVGCCAGPMPAAAKPLGEKLTWNTVLTIDQARALVTKIACQDDQFFLTGVIPDMSGERRPLAICNSQRQTIAVPKAGVLLGSLVCELALLHVRTFEDARERNFQARKKAIRKLVLAAAQELPR